MLCRPHAYVANEVINTRLLMYGTVVLALHMSGCGNGTGYICILYMDVFFQKRCIPHEFQTPALSSVALLGNRM